MIPPALWIRPQRRRSGSGMGEALPDMTKIIIGQRISSVRHADQIIILDDGRVSAIGTHEELLSPQ